MNTSATAASVGNVVLLGYRGSGKTTVGGLLAARLQLPFVDTDALVETAAGMPVREVFATRGEAHFRQLEAQALRQALGGAACVAALGGGAVLLTENQALIRTQPVRAWLRSAPEELLRRITLDPRSADLRPALTSASPADEIRQLLAARSGLYAALATMVVETDGCGPADVALEIARRLASTRETAP